MGGVVGDIADVLDPVGVWRMYEDAVSEIASWFGIESRVEILTDIQINNLLTAGVADREARRAAIRGSGGSSDLYIQTYKAFQREYKTRFNERWLENLGYLPSSTATTRVLNSALVLTYIQTFDASATRIRQLAIRYMTVEEAAWDWMEDNIGWSNQNQKATVGGSEFDVAISDQGTTIDMDLSQHYSITIEEDLTANYNYNQGNATVMSVATAPNTYELSGTSGLDIVQIRYTVDDGVGETFVVTPETAWTRDTAALEPGVYSIDIYETDSLDVETLTDTYDITVVGVDELWDVPLLDGTDLGGYYRTTVVSQYDASTWNIDTSIVTYHYDIPGVTDDNQKMWVKYDRGGTEWYYYTEDSATVPTNLYTSENIPVTSIITMKENNTIVDGDDRNLTRMLDKLGLTPDSFTASLNNADLDSAYLMTGISANSQTKAGKKLIFNMFDLIAPGSGDLSISIDQLNMTYSFTMTKTAVNEKIMEVGEYSNTLEDNGTTFRRRFRWQATETQYRELLVENFLLTYQISGQQLSANFGHGDDDLRLILPLDLFNNLKYREWVDVYEQSLAMLSYSYDEVRYEWYESSAFSIVMKIVAVVAAVIAIFFPPAWAVSAAAWAAASVGYVFTLVTFYVAVAVIIVGAGLAMNYALTYLIEELGLDPAVAGFIMAAAAIAMSDMSEITFGQEQWLPLATKAINGVSKIFAMHTEAKIKDIQDMDKAHLEKFKSENDTIINLLENMRGESNTANAFDMSIANQPVGEQPIDEQYNKAIGIYQCELDHLFPSAIPGIIDNKINVVVGS